MKINRLLDVRKIYKTRTYHFTEVSASHLELDKKVQELVALIGESKLSAAETKNYQNLISRAFVQATLSGDPIKPFTTLNQDRNLSREELLDSLEILLTDNKIDSKVSRRYLRNNLLQKILLCLIGLILIFTGFAMIIMPAPPSFEIFTVFYFNPNDGVTIMDLVSLLIILSGVFLFILNFNKK